jgi:hypothetical protein
MTRLPPVPCPPVCIHDIARRVDAAAARRWRSVLDRHRARLESLALDEPDAARAVYLRLLVRPIASRLVDEGLELYPRLPGGDPGELDPPAEGGGPEHWSVATVCTPTGTPLGTLVTAAHFDAPRFGLSRRPSVFGLDCVGLSTVRRELSRRLARRHVA